MRFNEYAQQARSTATYSGRGASLGKFYAALKLAGEAGEVADAVGKAIGRGEFGPGPYDSDHEALRDKMRDELGDVLWQLVAVADEFDLTLDEIAEVNGAKLAKRASSGTLLGGDRSSETIVSADGTQSFEATVVEGCTCPEGTPENAYVEDCASCVAFAARLRQLGRPVFAPEVELFSVADLETVPPGTKVLTAQNHRWIKVEGYGWRVDGTGGKHGITSDELWRTFGPIRLAS